MYSIGMFVISKLPRIVVSRNCFTIVEELQYIHVRIDQFQKFFQYRPLLMKLIFLVRELPYKWCGREVLIIHYDDITACKIIFPLLKTTQLKITNAHKPEMTN